MSGSESLAARFEAARNFFAHKSSHPPCLPGVVRKGEQDDVRRKGEATSADDEFYEAEYRRQDEQMEQSPYFDRRRTVFSQGRSHHLDDDEEDSAHVIDPEVERLFQSGDGAPPFAGGGDDEARTASPGTIRRGLEELALETQELLAALPPSPATTAATAAAANLRVIVSAATHEANAAAGDQALVKERPRTTEGSEQPKETVTSSPAPCVLLSHVGVEILRTPPRQRLEPAREARSSSSPSSSSSSSSSPPTSSCTSEGNTPALLDVSAPFPTVPALDTTATAITITGDNNDGDHDLEQGAYSNSLLRAEWNSLHHLQYEPPDSQRGALSSDQLPRFTETAAARRAKGRDQELEAAASSFHAALRTHRQRVQSPKTTVSPSGLEGLVDTFGDAQESSAVVASQQQSGAGEESSGKVGSPTSKTVKKIRVRWGDESRRLDKAGGSKAGVLSPHQQQQRRESASNNQGSAARSSEGASPRSEWRILFDEADTDGDGKLALRDVHRLLRRRLNLPPSELPQGQIDELFRLLNADASGLLSFEDLEVLLSGELVSLDRGPSHLEASTA